MNPERWVRVRQLAEAALELEPRQRQLFLAGECAEDSALRAEVASIIAGDDSAAAILDMTLAEAFPELFEADHARSLLGLRVGAYELVRVIASGGMGSVYVAQRADGQYEQEVAVKLINHRMASQAAIRQFLVERQTLARLAHPNIARMLDGGLAEDGMPYLVMEYVVGKPIDRYCKERKLPTETKLRLFRTVCSAVHYAHRHLVIHRDLKPGNILVTADGEPKLLDFGIAKLVTPAGIPDASDLSSSETRILTPEYASPEQLRGEPVTTATDIYSLGVTFYEVLTGHRPHRLKGLTPDRIQQIVCEREPAPPSTVVQGAEQVPTATGVGPASFRKGHTVKSSRLYRELVGDLDAIVLKALHKKPDHRYQSAEQLSEDLRRHLDHQPITARSGSLRYRTAKFIRRNRVAFIAAMAVLVSLLAGLTGTAWKARVAAEESRKARQVSSFLQQILASVDPNSTPMRDATVRMLLDEASRKIEDGVLAEQPEVEAEVRTTIGMTYVGLGVYDAAKPHLTAALDTRKQLFGNEHIDVAASLNNLGLWLKATGKYLQAEERYRASLELRRRLLGEDDVAVAETMNNLGVLLKNLRQWSEAESLHRRALATRRATFGDRHRDVATSLTNLASVLKNVGALDEAEPLYREALAIFRNELGGEHYRVAVCMNNLALLLRETQRFDEAESWLREALTIRRKVFGSEHPAVATGLHNLALILASMDQLDESVVMYEQALAMRRKLLGDEHPLVAYTANNLSDVLARKGDYESAEVLCRESLAIRRAGLPTGHPTIAGSLLVLGRILLDKNDPAAAEPVIREAVDIVENKLPDGHPRTAAAKGWLGECLLALESFDEAERLLLESQALIEGSSNRDPSLGQASLNRLIDLYQAWGRPDEAASYKERLNHVLKDR